jgi:hypothetical protein
MIAAEQQFKGLISVRTTTSATYCRKLLIEVLSCRAKSRLHETPKDSQMKRRPMTLDFGINGPDRFGQIRR